MAQLKDILETEKLRADMAQYLRINLFKEGTFYRAYEWSAWLCVRYINGFTVSEHRCSRPFLRVQAQRHSGRSVEAD